MDALDLFAGAGGWDVAARSLGLNVDRAETDPAANATARAAGFTTTSTRNVYAVDSTGYPGIVASPPCQSFSAANGAGGTDSQRIIDAVADGTFETVIGLIRLGRQCEDRRSALALTPLHHVAASRPDWTAWEQVPRVLGLWRSCAEVLEALGYHTWCGVLHAEAYGVPQTRRRAVLIAAHHLVGRPTPTHSRYYPRNPAKRDPGVADFVTLSDALGEVSVLSTYSTHGDYTNRGSREPDQPSATVTTKTSRNKVFGEIKRRGTIREADQPAPTLTASMGNDNFRWVDERPATTVVASHSPDRLAAPGWRYDIHRQDAEGSIRITPQQAGILQSFPPDYPWRGTLDQRYTQIGNAIPPLLGRAVIQEARGATAGQ